MRPGCFYLLLLVLVLGADSAQAEVAIDNTVPAVPGRGNFGTVALSDNEILMVGGNHFVLGGSHSPSDWHPTKLAEVFDVDSGEFRTAGSARYFYFRPRLFTLHDGRILVAGFHYDPTEGSERPDVYSPEIYDPEKNAWSLLHEIKFANDAATYANQLYDGRILFLTLSEDRVFPSTQKDAQAFRAWLYDSERESVEILSPRLSPRTGAFPIILPSGDVLVTGGSDVVFHPDESCEQASSEDPVDARQPNDDRCATSGEWISRASRNTEVWDIFWDELRVHEQIPFDGAHDLFTQFLESGDVLAVTRIDRSRRNQPPRSAAIWSVRAKQWTRVDDFPEYYHLDLNNDLLELNDAILVGPSGAYSLSSGSWSPRPPPFTGWPAVQLPTGRIGVLKMTEEPYWHELDTTSAEWKEMQSE